MDPNAVPRREDIVSWIEEFAYIFQSGLFDLDDPQVCGDESYHFSQDNPGAEAEVVDIVLRYPVDPSDNVSEALACEFPCCDTPRVYTADSDTWGTHRVGSDPESVNDLNSNPFYRRDLLRYEAQKGQGHKSGWKSKLFGSLLTKKPNTWARALDDPQPHSTIYGRVSHKAHQLLDAGSFWSLRQDDQPKEHQRQSYSQPADYREELDTLPRRLSSRHRVTRKPGLCPLRDSPEPIETQHRQGISTPDSSQSWLSDVKFRLKSLSPRSLAKKASTLRLQEKASLTQEDFQDVPSRVHALPAVPDATSSQTLPLPQNVSRETSTGSKTLTAESGTHQYYSSCADIRKHDIESSIDPCPTPPHLYQCTFCLAQCTSKLDWMEHERTYHFHSREWENTSERCSEDPESRNSSPVSQHCPISQHSSHTYVSRSSENDRPCSWNEFDEPMNDLFWNCGFCNFVLRSWDERQEHIAHEHFEQGFTMSLWDPLKAPYPWKRRIGAPIPGFSSWGLEELLAIQRPELAESMEHELNTKKASTCKLCHLPSKDKAAAAKHQEMWHTPRSVWSCPAAFSPDDTFFDTSRRRDGSIRDICLCCGKSFKYSQRDPEILMRHLRNAHGFDEYPCLQMCFDKEQFYLHLANSHDFYLEFIQDFMASCEMKGCAPAMMLESY